jgi:O-antigen ligase
MIKELSKIDLEKNLHVLLVLVSLVVLFFPSHILWSQSLIACVIWAVILWLRSREFHTKSFLAYLLIAFYFILVLSGIWAENKTLYLSAIRMKIMLLGIPFCFLTWSQWTSKQTRLFTKGLLLAVFLSAIYVLVNYLLHGTEILDGLLRGQPIPVPFKDHIRYAILLCFCLILSLYHSDICRKSGNKPGFYQWFCVSILLFFYIQFLAVKTGILLSILMVFSFISYKIWKKKIYAKGLVAFIFLFITFFFLANYVPTVKNKLSYFSWDMGKYKEKNYKSYSDGERIFSIMKGYEIAYQNPILGVGEGNLVRYMDSDTNKLPHNQFIVVWAQNGILGLILFIAVFVSSIWLAFKKSNWLAWSYTLALFIANMLEPMLETQLGLTIFILPLLILHSIETSDKD